MSQVQANVVLNQRSLAGSKKRTRSVEQSNSASTTLSSIACKRCRQRKVKCDGEYPYCSGCVKADVVCIIADGSASRDYTREEVHHLEEKLQALEKLLSSTRVSDSDVRSIPSSVGNRHTRTLAVQSSGANKSNRLLHPTLEHLRMRSQISFNKLLNPQLPPSSIFYHSPHRIPSNDAALTAIGEYFLEFHVAHPFLDRNQILSTLSCQPGPSSTLARPEKQRLFKLNMVLAIGSIKSFRSGLSDLHPFGFFTAALEACPPSESSFDSIEDIEMLLLIAWFGVYYNIGCSIWELGRLCVRIAIELELHRIRPATRTISLAGAQRRRIVFWESYILDRFSSSILGRPFAIDDSSIHIELPMQHLDTSACVGSSLAVFNTLAMLGQLRSRIHCSIHHKNNAMDTPAAATNPISERNANIAKVYLQVRTFTTELQAWRLSAPFFDQPSCLFETQGYFDLSYQETRLWLIRAALDSLVPSSTPPSGLLRACLQSAYNVVATFEGLRKKGLVTFTRSYAHGIFIAGLVIGIITKTQLHQHKERNEHASMVDVDEWFADLEDDSYKPTLDDALESLRVSGELLHWFAEQMPDVDIYSQSFEALRHEIRKSNTDTYEGQPRSPKERPEGLSTQHLQGTHEGGGGQPDLPSSHQTNHHSMNIAGVQDLAQAGRSGPESWSLFDPGVNMNELFSEPFHEERLQVAGNDAHTLQAMSWPFSSVVGIEGLDCGISEYIWDMIPPWQDSPSASMDSHH
ncbi:Pyrimidine pathway regulatory protein 1 [Ilyonectria robusta]